MTFLTLLGGQVTSPKCGTYVTPNGGSFAHDIWPVTQSPLNGKKINDHVCSVNAYHIPNSGVAITIP